MRVSDWSSDVCSSDLFGAEHALSADRVRSCDAGLPRWGRSMLNLVARFRSRSQSADERHAARSNRTAVAPQPFTIRNCASACLSATALNGLSSRHDERGRSEEHTSELQSLMRISYAVFCLKKKNKH